MNNIYFKSIIYKGIIITRNKIYTKVKKLYSKKNYYLKMRKELIFM